MEHFLWLYMIPLLVSFFVATFGLATILFITKRVTWLRRIPEGARKHSKAHIPRLGGAALILATLITALWLPTLVLPQVWITFGYVLLAAAIVGVWDDVCPQSWQRQLTWQSFFVLVLYMGGLRILTLTNPLGGVWQLSASGTAGFLLLMLWFLLLINTLNWLDGIDGLCGSVSLVGYLALFLLALSPVVYQPPVAILAMIALGATLAFLVWNFPAARIMAGTSGTLFFGLTLAFLSVVAGTKIATALLVLALPLLDAALVFVKRLLAGRPVTAADEGHAHHMLRRLGYSERAIVVGYSAITLFLLVVALATKGSAKFVLLFLIFTSLGCFLAMLHFPGRQKLFRILGFGLGAAALAWFLMVRVPLYAVVGGHWYTVEVAQSEAEQERGLSHRGELCVHCSMLFPFKTPTEPRFWMKDMQFSIDLAWIADGRIIGKEERLAFPSLETVAPPSAVNAVLELPAGSLQKIPPGTRVYLLP
jgi:UDP-GlcNAc:undecaprenyl-phosphate GlcNAc-1-phosphate transferase